MNIDIDAQKIFEGKVGSQLYGTATPESDIDYVGIMIAPEDYYFGLLNVSEINLDIKSKLESGKNSKDAVDRKFYEIRNFARLALQNNPNILEILYLNEDSIVFKNNYFDELQLAAPSFLCRDSIFTRFISYASSQRHKMVIKEKHFTELSDAYEYFSVSDSCQYLLECRGRNLLFLSEDDKYFKIGDLNFQKHLTIKKVTEFLGERLCKITNRYELVLKHGFDTKFGSHLIRLLLEGEELLTTGKLVFPLVYADLLLSIKRGDYEVGKVLEMATQIEDRMRDAKEKSFLPSKPKFYEINELIKSMAKTFLTTGVHYGC
jgi:predicted nucleotidyltransferase